MKRPKTTLHCDGDDRKPPLHVLYRTGNNNNDKKRILRKQTGSYEDQHVYELVTYKLHD
ncbi:hypothetical protein [Methanococcoides seepicolus]|uniref:Uncharacterized protein n=1 Tax=Methanococcoides seepicolus TaxID=2828780 RepID=A0A9E5D9S6_9EURY|nr:hypothetical protein [Methanococcoides seepicolus]MCM1985706.1 hypothetical protein [Methanococcoides seepicolus]